MRAKNEVSSCRQAGKNPGGVRFSMWLLLVLALGLPCLSSRAATHYVNILDSTFIPDALSVEAGDTVIWTQNDLTTEHTVTSHDSLFDSDAMSYGDMYSVVFTEAGTYTYFCVFHGSSMSGVIVVAEPGPNNAPFAPVNVLPANNASNQPVAVQLRASAFSDPDAIDFHGASRWVVRYASNNAVAVDSGEVTGGSLTNYSPAGLAEGTTYDWQVRYKDGRGMWSGNSAATRFTTLVSVSAEGNGLRASYNNTADFVTPLVVVTNATVDYSWGTTRPHRRITADDFAVRWEGSLLPEFTQPYQIQLQYRGRARVWVSNQLIIDEWNGCSFSQTRRGSVSLVAGQLAPVRVEYAADPAGAQAILRWASGTNLPMEVIPTERLFPPAP